MNVELLNPEVLESIYKNHGEFACECYNTPVKYAEKVGEKCQESGHYSGSRTQYIKFRISGIDRGTAEQMLRHEIGVRYFDIDNPMVNIDENPMNIVKNMKSFRYVDMDTFSYTIPDKINNNKTAKELYCQTMCLIDESIKTIKTIINDDTKETLEAAQFLLPRATHTSVTIGFTPEALMHYMWKRLCVRTQPEHRKLAIKIKSVVCGVNAKFGAKLIPHCQELLWCPEGAMSCGAVDTKEKLIERLKAN